MSQPTRDPTATSSLAFPSLLALAAPLTVVVCIEYLHSVWWTFALYQLGICLVAPALESRREGRSWREHAILLGLLVPDDRDHQGSGLELRPALVLGVATALLTAISLVLTRDRFLEPERLEATVTTWGVSPGQVPYMLAFMALVNAPSEELFWRGYLPGRVAMARPGSRPPVLLTVILPAFLYASYHVTTIHRLVSEPAGVVLMISGVWGAGLVWGWLRRRTGSVWPPLLSHSGAVLAYLAVHLWITRNLA